MPHECTDILDNCPQAMAHLGFPPLRCVHLTFPPAVLDSPAASKQTKSSVDSLGDRNWGEWADIKRHVRYWQPALAVEAHLVHVLEAPAADGTDGVGGCGDECDRMCRDSRDGPACSSDIFVCHPSNTGPQGSSMCRDARVIVEIGGDVLSVHGDFLRSTPGRDWQRLRRAGFWHALAGPGKRLAEAELLIIPLNRR